MLYVSMTLSMPPRKVYIKLPVKFCFNIIGFVLFWLLSWHFETMYLAVYCCLTLNLPEILYTLNNELSMWPHRRLHPVFEFTVLLFHKQKKNQACVIFLPLFHTMLSHRDSHTLFLQRNMDFFFITLSLQ